MWRPEDEALLKRIENELVVEALWRRETRQTTPLHPRAAGLVGMLRERPGGEVVVSEAALALSTGDDPARARGLPDPAAISALLRPTSMKGLPPPLLHHLAVFHERVADATADEVAFGARLRALAAWFAMTHERRYLDEVIRGALGTDTDLEAHRVRATRRPLDQLGLVARQGARALDEASRGALRALAATEQAARLAGLSGAETRPLVVHAERLRAAAIDAALGPIADVIAELSARNAHEADGPAAMERIVAAWHWSSWDEHVERFAVDEATPVAWTIYQRETGFAHLRRLIHPLEPIIERLARRVQDDPTAIAYAAPVAQMYVFRSEMAEEPDARRRLAERSVAVCPSHRNGRYILARQLITEVRERVNRGFWLLGDRNELEQLLDRAEQLNPEARGLQEMRERVASLGGWLR